MICIKHANFIIPQKWRISAEVIHFKNFLEPQYVENLEKFC